MARQYPVRLADTHCHLDFDVFADDRREVIERARDNGLVRILNPGIDLVSSRAAIELADEYPEIYAAVGIHPNSANTWNHRSLDELESLARHPKVVAIGEIGLDYYRDRAPREKQLHVLMEQLELAARANLPVILHNREAGIDLIPILEKWQEALEAQDSPLHERAGVLHSFSETADTAVRMQEKGFYIGISGPVTFRNSWKVQEVARQGALDRIILETDAPFLTPDPHRGQRNEPAYVLVVAQTIADLRDTALESFAHTTTANAGRLFNWREIG